MTVMKRYTLKTFISLKYITATVADRNNRKIVASVTTAEHHIKNTLECGRTSNEKSAAAAGEVLAMRLKLKGLDQGQGRGIHYNPTIEIANKGFQTRPIIWALVNALKNNGVKLIIEDADDDGSVAGQWLHGHHYGVTFEKDW